jgi:phage anti-repressor protein
MLQKYGILTLNKGTTDIKNLINQNNFIENEDYKLRNVSEFNSKGGRGNKNEYYLHPRAFKMCLMRSLKTKQYARYYLLLEEAIKYFNDYQNLLKEKYIIKLKFKIDKKDNKIDKLEEKVNKLLENNESYYKIIKKPENIMKKLLKEVKKWNIN